MQIFNLDSLKSFPYEEREKNVFFKTKEFKIRIIDLIPNKRMPDCEMSSHVILIVVEGEVKIKVNKDKATLIKNQCLVTEPGLISMETKTGARLVGIQINKN